MKVSALILYPLYHLWSHHRLTIVNRSKRRLWDYSWLAAYIVYIGIRFKCLFIASYNVFALYLRLKPNNRLFNWIICFLFAAFRCCHLSASQRNCGPQATACKCSHVAAGAGPNTNEDSCICPLKCSHLDCVLQQTRIERIFKRDRNHCRRLSVSAFFEIPLLLVCTDTRLSKQLSEVNWKFFFF